MTNKKTKTEVDELINIEVQKIREQQERQALLFGADALLPQKQFDRELEKHQLRNGLEFTIKEVKDLIIEMAGEYSPMFTNKKPFFKLMYKLHGWDKLDPTEFIKPPCVALYIKKYVYARFPKDILPTLLAKENPLINGYVRKYKLFQFLNDSGLVLLEGYIQDAIDVMKKSKTWYDFELKYTKKYKLSVQLKCIKD